MIKIPGFSAKQNEWFGLSVHHNIQAGDLVIVEAPDGEFFLVDRVVAMSIKPGINHAWPGPFESEEQCIAVLIAIRMINA